MFQFFKRKVGLATNPLHEKAAGWLVGKVLWLQNKWALFMDRRINRLPTHSKKICLLIFVVLSLVICTSIVIETFTSSHKTKGINIGNIRFSKHASSTGEVRASPAITQNQYKRIIAFRHYMDSLSVSVPCRKVFDSINRCRPGLLDSAISLERLYHAQNK